MSDPTRWLAYACKTVLRRCKSLHYDDACSAAGWGLATALRNYDGSIPFRPYLIRGAWQCGRESVRWSSTHGITKAKGTRFTPIAPNKLESSDSVDAVDARIDVEILLSRLAPDDRRIVRMRMEERSFTEIAGVMGLSPTGVLKRHRRIIEQLREAA